MDWRGLAWTGVDWRPVFNVLEAHHPVVRVNAQHMRAVPGRKTDVKDRDWLADRLADRLAPDRLRPSFIPPPPVRALRERVGSRRSLVQARTQEINRVHQLLERANSKLAAVATDGRGTSGRAMLDGLMAGDHDPAALAILSHLLREHKPDTDLGVDYFDRLDTERLQRRSVQRLEQLGYTLTLTPAPAA